MEQEFFCTHRIVDDPLKKAQQKISIIKTVQTLARQNTSQLFSFVFYSFLLDAFCPSKIAQ